MDENGKAKKKLVGDKKWCPPCGKYEPKELFPPGSGQCAAGRQIMQNLKNQSRAQGREKWWEETCADPKKLVRVCNNYKCRCPPPPPGKKREGFNIAVYLEEIRQEQAVLYDGIQEMMSLPHFVSWMAKPKNGSMDPQEAATERHRLHNAEGAITDKLGRVPKHPERVAVKKTDIITDRDAYIKAQTLQLQGKQKKNPMQEDIAKMAYSMREGPKAASSTLGGRSDQAKLLVNAKTAAVLAGGDGAFSDAGRAAIEIGDVRDLDSDEEAAAKQGGDDEDGGGAAEVGAGGKRKKGEAAAAGDAKKQKGAEDKKKPWFDRDSQVAAALRAHQTWQKGMQRDLAAGIEAARDMIESVPTDYEDNVKNEMKLCKNRLYALRLVLGSGGHGGGKDGGASDDPWDMFESKWASRRVVEPPAEAGGGGGAPAAQPCAADAAAAPPADTAGGAPAAELPAETAGGAPATQVADAAAGEGAGAEQQNSAVAPTSAVPVVKKPRWNRDRKDQTSAEETVAIAAKEPGGNDSGPSKPDEEVGGDAGGCDSKSTVANFYQQTGGDGSKALKRYIASFSATSGKPELGSAPPCRSYRSLIVFSEFDTYSEKIEVCETKEALVAISNSMKPFKAAYTDLLSMSKAAVTRLKNAIDDAKKDKAKGADAQGSSGPGKKRGRPKREARQAVLIMVENWSQVADPVKTFPVVDGKVTGDVDWSCPVILRVGVQEYISAQDVGKFQAKFQVDPSRIEPGRSQKKLNKEGSEKFNAAVDAILPELRNLKDEKKKTEQIMPILNTTVFAIAKGRTTCSAESGHLAVVRYGIKVGGCGAQYVYIQRFLPHLPAHEDDYDDDDCDSQVPIHFNHLPTSRTDGCRAEAQYILNAILLHASTDFFRPVSRGGERVDEMVREALDTCSSVAPSSPRGHAGDRMRADGSPHGVQRH